MSAKRAQRQAAQNYTGSRFAMIMWGAAVGAGLALLFAPKRGTALRKDLATSAADLAHRAGKAYDGAVGAIGTLIANGARAAENSDRFADRARH